MRVHERVLFGTLMALLTLGACKKAESVEVGGECSTRDDCKNRNDCMGIGDGQKVCTRTCVPMLKDCPAPTTCQTVNLTVNAGAGKTASATGVHFCLP